jgi:Hemerythrin HHE cation binding domain
MSVTSEQLTSTASRLLAAVSVIDAISILREDHRRIDDLFRQFEKARGDGQRSALASRICSELLIHAQVEEEIFYPALREAIGDADLMDEADVEHAVAANLVLEIMGMQPGDRHYGARVKVLGEYVRHHVQEEQNRMFSKAREARLDMRALGEQITERKQELKRSASFARLPAIAGISPLHMAAPANSFINA